LLVEPWVAPEHGAGWGEGNRDVKQRDAPVGQGPTGEDEPIPLFKVFMPESVMDPLRKVLFSGYIGHGPRVDEFEEKLAPWLGSSDVLALNNGTAALQLALRLADVVAGDEVISTPVTCMATSQPILACGAKVVWADIDPRTGNIDPQDIERRITARTRAIMAVHWGGYPCDLAEINALAEAHGLKVIEDACHAFGASYRGAPIGSHSDFVCFSFQAIKEITTVDGGALICRSASDCERGRMLRWYGIDRRGPRTGFRCEEDVGEYGYKFSMNDVVATIGLEQLQYVGQNLAQTRVHAERYDEAFAGLRSISTLRREDDRQSSHWLYTLKARDREGFAQAMNGAGIAVSQVHARNDTHTLFRESRVDLPGVDEFTSQHICIPVGSWLEPQDLERIIDAVTRYDARAGA